MNFIKTPAKGMRDILPQEMELREYVINEILNTYKKFGFDRIETPSVEHIENLTNNQGGENEKLIFKIMKRGEKLNLDGSKEVSELVDSGLRYDLTVPLSRYYANNMNDLPLPFKAIQIGHVWRAERPQKGRFREFMQCDIDVFGEKTNLAEIELINATTTLLKKIGLKNFKIKINDRRILTAMALYVGFQENECNNIFITLDKIDKIGEIGVKEEFLNLGYETSIIDKYLNLFKSDASSVNSFCGNIFNDFLENDVIKNLDDIIDTIKNITNVNIVFDPTLVRGMSYYTGPIFEIQIDSYPGSIAGGGRYDKMVEKYANVSVPACGFSIGFERLINILIEQNYHFNQNVNKYAYIINKDINQEALKKCLKEVNKLRSDGNIVNLLYKSKNYKHQIEMLKNKNYTIKQFE